MIRDYRSLAVAALHAPDAGTKLNSLDVTLLAALALTVHPTEEQLARFGEIERKLDARP